MVACCGAAAGKYRCHAAGAGGEPVRTPRQSGSAPTAARSRLASCRANRPCRARDGRRSPAGRLRRCQGHQPRARSDDRPNRGIAHAHWTWRPPNPALRAWRAALGEGCQSEEALIVHPGNTYLNVQWQRPLAIFGHDVPVRTRCRPRTGPICSSRARSKSQRLQVDRRDNNNLFTIETDPRASSGQRCKLSSSLIPLLPSHTCGKGRPHDQIGRSRYG